jgi:hypothetical protein
MKKQNPAPQENRIDALVGQLQKEGRLPDLEPELRKFDPTSLEGMEQESWHHYYGIVSFLAGNRAQAFERFQEGLRICRNSAKLSFSLGQEYEYKADIENMFACSDRAKFPGISGAYVMAQARFAYLWNRNTKGIEYLQPLVEVCRRLRILDGTFLYIRQIPDFDQIWSTKAAFHYLLGDVPGLRVMTEHMERTCLDFDFERLRLKLTGMETGDDSPLQERLRADIADATKNGWPTGYLKLQLRVLEAQSEDDPEAAERTLDAVEFDENDYPWLDDMRLLAKCELAQRAGEEAREAGLQTEFFKRQPMLFEPHNAINFNLLVYQENLKAWYRKSASARV